MSPIKFPGEKIQEHRIEMIRRSEEEDDTKKSSELFGLPYINLAFKSPERSALELIPEEDARKADLAVIHKKGDSLEVALISPRNPYAKKILERLEKEFGEVSVFVVSPHSLQKAWAGYVTAKSKEKISGEVAVSPQALKEFREEIRSITDLKGAIEQLSHQKSISLVVEILLAGALALDASDIHIEPEEESIRLRLRIDGLMRDVLNFDAHMHKLILSRIKLLSNMKLNIKTVSQDGRFSVSFGDFEIQIRSSILPGEYGENIVLRVLNPSSLLSLHQLGIRKDILGTVENQIKKPNGMILATGPTGSGKTTTLYAFLKKLKTPEVKIITIEDPIEYHLLGISQTQAAPERGYTFASGLRSILRQDPDIILIGEIRDLETADTALQASLTGHLLLSTLHTNDAAGVVPRLVDIGASPSVIGPALSMAIAQRLVRRICDDCKTMRKATEQERQKLSAPELVRMWGRVDPALEVAEARGCKTCDNAGYKGRIGIYEILINTPLFERFILTNPSVTEIREYAKKNGMITLKQDGLLKVLEGITTIEEVERVAGE
ncbi:MAG: type II/IV secretion system protein [Candidatus Spechtbacterales bacterium]